MLPPRRNYLLACGLDSVLTFLENWAPDAESIAYLASLDQFTPEFLAWLRAARFTGEVRAVPEGTPVFPNEPVLEVTGPLALAQIVETYVMNQVHMQTLQASKAARVVAAARGRPVVDFGARRYHGVESAVQAARTLAIAGVSSTSNVLAGRRHGLPVAGTMAHSYVQSFESELDAFRTFSRRTPGTTLIVDTYDSLRGVRNVVALAAERGDDFDVAAIRLDSGDLAALAFSARHLLDEAGLQRVRIFVSGGLDENRVSALVARGAPIDAFGVGTRMGVSDDAPALECVYKLTAYDGVGRIKLSPGKRVLPGRKQIWRTDGDHDEIGREGEELPGRPLLRTVMRDGQRLPGACVGIAESRAWAEVRTRAPAAAGPRAPAGRSAVPRGREPGPAGLRARDRGRPPPLT